MNSSDRGAESGGGWAQLAELSSETDAMLLEGYLESAGIECQIESLVFHAEPVTLGQLSRVRVHVLRQDLETARDLLAQVQTDSAASPPSRS
jgi:protein required for attachment to host cells